MISYITLKTKFLSDLLLVANEKYLIGIYFLNSKFTTAKNNWQLDAKHPVLRQACAELQEYLDGERKKFTVPLHYEGTDFQKKVWQEIAHIPFGKTITYSELAGRTKSPNAIRAAGTATGKNPLCIIIPCHRVIGKDGGIGGYGGGLDRKRHLLQLENVGNSIN